MIQSIILYSTYMLYQLYLCSYRPTIYNNNKTTMFMLCLIFISFSETTINVHKHRNTTGPVHQIVQLLKCSSRFILFKLNQQQNYHTIMFKYKYSKLFVNYNRLLLSSSTITFFQGNYNSDFT